MKALKFIRMPALIILLLYVGCSKEQNEGESELQNIKQKLAALEFGAELLKTRIDGIQNYTDLHEMFYHHEHVVFNPTAPEEEYGRIDTSAGTFLISIKDVKPYLSGYKVALEIGNINHCTYKGFKLNAKWGKAYDYKKKDTLPLEEWKKSLSEKSASFTIELKPGRWNKVDLVLAPAKADEFDYLEITMETNTVSLSAE